jgi:glycosyltransferase involved in cell wall biosynthesis
MLSLVIPLYRSEPNLGRLFQELAALAEKLPIPLEVVFVNDGSPDGSEAVLARSAPELPFASRVIHLSRNFGAFAAITAGLRYGGGKYFGVLAADLQEPPRLMVDFVERLLSGQADIVFGVRASRADPFWSTIGSNLFWHLYRMTVNSDIPRGGVDVFACTRQVRDEVLQLKEVDSSLLALLFWIGFRRAFVTYNRQPRTEGKSAWTLSKKLRYALNGIFNFTDLPVRILLSLGALGIAVSVFTGALVLAAKLLGDIAVPGYTPIVLSVLFFGGLTASGLGIVGQYLWLTLQNVRNRPLFIVREERSYAPVRPLEAQSGPNPEAQSRDCPRDS